MEGTVADMERNFDLIVSMRTQLNGLLADFTGQNVEKVAEDTDRDFWMTAQEAKEYGIVDEVLIQRELADKKQLKTTGQLKMANKDSSQALKCSFCGKSQKQVIKLIAGPGVYICDECIELCVEIIEEEKVEKLETSSEEYLPLPKEINQSLNEYIIGCLLYTSPSPRDRTRSRMPSSA